MLIDTHAHVNFRGFKDDAMEVLRRSLDEGIQVINVGSQIDTSRQAVELANKFGNGVYALVGLHPEHTHSQHVDEEESHFLSREEKFDYQTYRELAKDPKVVGIGECGLDYYRLPEGVDHDLIKEKQKEAFRAQVRLAKELNKVLVIHSRPAKGDESLYDDLLAILDEEKFVPEPRIKYGASSMEGQISPKSDFAPSTSSGIKIALPSLRFVVHSYTGSPESLQKFLDRGGYVSFNGIVTFDKTGNMEKLVKSAPLDRIVLETDCPYLAPVPMRGKRNEPAYVKYVAQKVGDLLGMPEQEIAEKTTANARRLFSL